jgi:phage-related minor tail protein
MNDVTDSFVNLSESAANQMRALRTTADDFGLSISRAFASGITQGKKFEDVLKTVALRLSSSMLNSALQPLEKSLFGGLSGLFGGGTVTPFANGGVVSAPTYFPMRGGMGLMGEAGAEAIMPLARGSDGKLGVRGGGGTTVNVSINATDAASFMRSEAQVSAALARAVARGKRAL